MTFSQPHERRLGGYLLHVLPTHGRSDRNRSYPDWWKHTLDGGPARSWLVVSWIGHSLCSLSAPTAHLCGPSLSPEHVTNTLSTGRDRWRRHDNMRRRHVLGRPASSHRINFCDSRRGVVWLALPGALEANKVPALEDTKGSVRHR